MKTFKKCLTVAGLTVLTCLISAVEPVMGGCVAFAVAAYITYC